MIRVIIMDTETGCFKECHINKNVFILSFLKRVQFEKKVNIMSERFVKQLLEEKGGEKP